MVLMRTIPGTVLLLLVLMPPIAAQQISPGARTELVPSGTLRVGVNFGNALLASKDPASGREGGWDVAFLATDPGRAGEIAFTAPYVEIDSTYLVPARSPLRPMADVDRPGVRIAVSEKSAYDLFHFQAQFVRRRAIRIGCRDS